MEARKTMAIKHRESKRKESMPPLETSINEPWKEVQRMLAALTERMGSFEKRLPVASRSDQERSESPLEHNRRASESLNFTRIENMLEKRRAEVNTKRKTALDTKRRIEVKN